MIMGNNKKDYLKLKKDYGEKFAQYCKSTFPTLLDRNMLYEVVSKSFVANRFLYDDLVANNRLQSFNEYIYGNYDDGVRQGVFNENIETPEVLMRRAGYRLKKINKPEDFDEFVKYYADDELLCSFRNPERKLVFHTVFFAVKDGAEDIERGLIPRRQDPYGTSVISIQFSKAKKNRMLSIKNRYNHTVPDSDATFSNDLENIYPGLTDSFIRHYNIDLSKSKLKFSMPNYVMANDNKFYKYNYHIRNFYYCPDNVVIIDGEPIRYDKGKYEVFDYFVLDKKHKFMYFAPHIDAFVNQFDKMTGTEVTKVGEDGDRLITIHIKDGEDIEIVVNKLGQMISFKNPNLTKMGNYFLHDNEYLESIDVDNVEEVDDYVLTLNQHLKEKKMSKVKSVGKNFLSNNENIDKEI